jgi:TPR repeat protein
MMELVNVFESGRGGSLLTEKEALLWRIRADQRTEAASNLGELGYAAAAAGVALPPSLLEPGPGYALGLAYIDSGEGAESVKKGLYLIERASNRCYPPALYRFCALIEEGVRTGRSVDDAISCYKSSSNCDDPESSYRLARVYEDGLGVAKDAKEALRWYKMAVVDGHVEAAWRLSRLLGAKGGAGEEDALESAKLLRQAAEGGHLPAMLEYSRILLTSKGAIERSKGRELVMSAALAGDGEAVKQLQEAAASGDDDAKAILAVLGR